MTDNIIDLAAHRPNPHLAGKAKCTACKHQWVAVAPIGTDRLQCPSCDTLRGVWLAFCTGREGIAFRVCACGCDVFVLSVEELICTACGLQQTGWYYGQDPAPPDAPRRA